MPRAVLALFPALALAACGGLRNPDLGTGSLTGRLRNATADAYVYPLGRPDLVVRPAADGRYTLESVPVDTTALVAVDGPSGSWRAALVPVAVAGAGKRTAPEVDAASMPPAGRVGAVARLGGGCESSATRFTVLGTEVIDVAPAAAGAAAILEPLPAGTFRLGARSVGFTPRSVEITVASGTTIPYDVSLSVEAGDPAPGCTAEGARCRAGLVCNAGDGACYECLADDHCIGPLETLCANNACHLPAASGETCDPCTSGVDCASGVCAVEGGFCTRSCSADGECPAGFACRPDGAGKACQAPRGCAEAKEALGAECFHDATCADALAGGACFGATLALDPPAPGYCTGACDPSRPDDCTLVPGYACSATSRFCEKT
ncbi:MAG TPA: hypothetical protein VIW03_14135 [Anaeromyxobacter sp.]